MDIKTQFDQAGADSKNLNKKPDNEILLQLYALYRHGEAACS